MKPYLVALAIGLLVGALYSLLGTRSPAPPMIALLGLLGMLLGEQATVLAMRALHGQEVALFWRKSCAERVIGLPPAAADDPS
jgi:XapX domain-containing protein